jgi:hypothetical protein
VPYKGQGLFFESSFISATARCLLTIISIFFLKWLLGQLQAPLAFFSRADSTY